MQHILLLLIALQGHDNFDVRQAASESLVQIGQTHPTLNILAIHTNNPDLEIARRCKDVSIRTAEAKIAYLSKMKLKNLPMISHWYFHGDNKPYAHPFVPMMDYATPFPNGQYKWEEMSIDEFMESLYNEGMNAIEIAAKLEAQKEQEKK